MYVKKINELSDGEADNANYKFEMPVTKCYKCCRVTSDDFKTICSAFKLVLDDKNKI